MVAGLLAFYHAVMYVQLPGFINAVPNRAVTWLLVAFLLLGTAALPWVGFSAYLPYSLLHAILYVKGLWGKPTYYPNLITIAGLLLLPPLGVSAGGRPLLSAGLRLLSNVPHRLLPGEEEVHRRHRNRRGRGLRSRLFGGEGRVPVGRGGALAITCYFRRAPGSTTYMGHRRFSSGGPWRWRLWAPTSSTWHLA
jgi:hypothetical protein